MRRVRLRTLMVLVGLLIALSYATIAYVLYRLLAAVWAIQPGALVTAATIAGATLVLAYASYRTATGRVLEALEADAVDRDRAPWLHHQLDVLCVRMDVARPRLYVAEMGEPNALALGGPDGGAIVLDRGLFRLLDPPEMACVIAHELAHLGGRDGLVQTLSFSLLRTATSVAFVALAPPILLLTGLARGLAWARGEPATWTESPLARIRSVLELGIVVGFFAFTVVLLAHSRHREFRADALAADATGRPLALARALRKIERATQPEPGLLTPLCVHGDEDGVFVSLLSSHPSMDARVERLRERAGTRGPAS